MDDLDKITTWANRWKMVFNPDISKQAIEVVFSRKYNKGDHPPLVFNGVPVARKDATKHLGIILDEKLSFRKHILESIEKAKKGLSLMKFLSKYVSRKVLIMTYTMHVRPHLEYGDIIFHNCSEYLMEMLESIQYQAGLIATGCWQKTSRLKLYEELGWESLDSRRSSRRLFTYHKIISQTAPNYLSDYVLSEPAPDGRSQRYKRTFFPDCFTNWSSLDPALRSLDFLKFKKSIIKSSRPAKKEYFNVSDRYGLKLITRLRVEHSDLRAHRFQKNFNCPDPVCACGMEDETIEHYFLRCPRYAAHRSTLLNKLNGIFQFDVSTNLVNLSEILLYGQSGLCDSKNKNILASSIDFIKSSKRFKYLEAFVSEEE
jgi:hypothetical protein